MARELGKLVDDIPAIAAKGYPKWMIEFLEQKVAKYRTEIDTAHAPYLSHIGEAGKTDTSKIDKVTTITSTCDAAAVHLSSAKQAFDKGPGKDIKNLSK